MHWNRRPIDLHFMICNTLDLSNSISRIVDPYLRGKISPECFKRVVETAVKCLADEGVYRPSMRDVLRDLEYALELQESPPKGTSKDFAEDLIDSTRTELPTSVGSLSLMSEGSHGFEPNDVKN
ncbi:hypothetical protein L1987_64678 [Smallanthus sonchifolius]|uniref:Uncharacterized protein n=1 Tax=Smallanthus sonchifolius TaxID=185202 RepID=A0ACB9BSD3_9ASTR|nr:hypothetical protein L1987_87613 [Smallanthus sonchifolius]KAI3724910.1 hypothetical protein L1987_64678 [Smallanthus sonchifolius]